MIFLNIIKEIIDFIKTRSVRKNIEIIIINDNVIFLNIIKEIINFIKTRSVRKNIEIIIIIFEFFDFF